MILNLLALIRYAPHFSKISPINHTHTKESVNIELVGGIRTHDHRCVRVSFGHEFVHKVERSLDGKIVEREVELFRNYLKILGRSPRTINDSVMYI